MKSNHNLDELRVSLDSLDAAMIYLLAERFRLTHKVGEYKRDNELPPVDLSREQKQFQRIEELAGAAGLDPDIAKRYLRMIIDEVVKEHTRLQKDAKRADQS